jgi:hypothetical protein
MTKQSEQLDIFLAPPPPRLNGIFIPGDVISKKNSQNAIQIPLKGARKCHSCGKMHPSRGMITSSKAHQAYVRNTKAIYERLAPDFRKLLESSSEPYRIAFQFIRARNGGVWDYSNIVEAVQDQMVTAQWITDDSHQNMIPVFIPAVVDKDNPGVIIAPIA